MSEENLDSLLSRMGAIAEAVNAFKSEAVQQSAFDALVAAFHGKPTAAAKPQKDAQQHEADAPEPSQADGEDTVGTPTNKKPAKRKNSGGSAKSFQLVKDLDLRPAGKKSFSDFIAEKQPASNEDKYAVAVYYLQHVLELPAVTANHVGTVFRLESTWREPGDLLAGLRVASSRKGTLNTSSWENLTMTPQGRNFVEHDLPKPTKAKK